MSRLTTTLFALSLVLLPLMQGEEVKNIGGDDCHVHPYPPLDLCSVTPAGLILLALRTLCCRRSSLSSNGST
eukprot:3186384-Rhodomonas_salina.3